MEYDLTPEPKKTMRPIPPLAKQLMGIHSGERTVELDEKGLLAEDVVCRQCSYNLRGLDVQSRCPECGTAIGWSIHGNFLRYSDPVWVKQLSDGALWMAVSILVGIIATVLASAVFGAEGATIAQLIGSGIGLVGYWKITSPDPGHPETNPIWNIRQMTRILAVAAFMSNVLSMSLNLTSSVASSMQVLAQAGSYILSLSGTVAALLLFILMRRIALRIPNDDLASRTRIVMWGLIGAHVLLLVGGLVAILSFSMGSGGGFGFGAFAILGCMGAIALLGFGIWWIVLLFRYRSALNAAVAIAKQTWLRHAAQSYDHS